ncbi:MFS transporter [Gryllotalpicola reticulitermitis]|uniref:MFS transporter n=1 Tax=Gryllotalpicola reticulitermitis TaxID=1184153 RepID=A0ABV8Q795_9MICO
MSAAAVPDAPANALPVIPRSQIVSWALWDWAYSAFNAVATTFVFTRYLTSSSFGDPNHNSALLGWFLGVSAALIALIAPVAGQRTDASGRRKLWLAINSGVVGLCLLATVFVKDTPAYLWLGLLAISIGTIFYEFASVSYNAMLRQVSTPATVGKVSAFGWSMGYFGGIVLMIIVYVLFIVGSGSHVGLLHVPTAGGWYVRLTMLVATAWAVGFSIPILIAVKEPKVPTEIAAERTSFLGSYRVLFHSLSTLWRESRNTVWFLLASAIFRDGLTGVFTFGGILAGVTFGFSTSEVLVFGIAANVTAGIATVSVGALDDRIGPKPLIVTSLAGMIVCALVLFFLHGDGKTVFWIFGLILSLFVGPAQSASRTFLSRVIPDGREGEVFGLYATTGRAATFLAPVLFSLFITIGGKQVWGILGITIVLVVGLAVLIPVKPVVEKAVIRKGA